MKIKFDVSAQELVIIQQILRSSLPSNCKVWVFGSRAKHQAKYNSDLDLAIEGQQPLDKNTLMQLETQFDESRLPYNVDIVDMHKTEAYFKTIIDQQKVPFPLKNNVPKLRFPEFHTDWKEKTLGEFMRFKNGINADKNQYGYGRKFINVLDIIADRAIYHDNIIGSVNVPDKEFEKNEVVFGDILFQRSSETRKDAGQSNIYLDKNMSATFGGFVIRGRPTTEFNPIFFDFLLKTNLARKEITTKSGGSTRFNVGQESLGSVMVVLTLNAEEQRKIASFLSAVDDKLSKLHRKKELLETYKRGLMQKLFSQEIRFKQDDGSDFPDWENKNLGELGQFFGGGTPSTSIKNYWEGHIPWVSSSDLSEGSIHNLATTKFITLEAIKDSATKIVPKGSLLIVSRVGVGKLAIALEDVCTSQDFANFTPREDNIYFLGYLLLYKKNNLLSIGQGTSIKGFTNSDLASLKVSFPCQKEQQKIADCLTAFDKKIELIAKQITQLDSFKKGLLQKLFV